MIDESDVKYRSKRKHEKKVIVGTILGIVIVLFGAYRLTAVERNSGEGISVATDTTTPVSITLTPNREVDVEVFPAPERKTPAKPAAPQPVRSTNETSEIIPAGTMVSAKLATYVSSRDAKAGDKVVAVTIKDVSANGRVVIPAGTTVTGQVVEAGPSFLRINFSQIGAYRTRLALVSPNLDQRAASQNGNSTAYDYRSETIVVAAGERITLRLSENVRF